VPVVFQLTLNKAAVDAAGLDAAGLFVVDVTRRVLNRAIVLTPVDTGNLRAQNNMRVMRQPRRVIGEVFNDTVYAAAVHNGTRAHTVRPVRRKALRWTTKAGDVVFAKSARIPARRGRPWIFRALQEVAGAQGFTVTRLP